MISAKDIPHFTGDLEQLEQHASGLRNHAGALRQAGSVAHSKFQGLGAFYHAPEAERLFASTAPVRDRADVFASKIETVAGALDDYAGAVRPIIARLDRLRTRVADFAASLKTDSGEIDDEWTQDQDKIDQHDALWAEVNQAQADFTTAEITANNKITALVDGAQYVQQGYEGTLVPLGAQIYGYTAEALKHADKLPWGTPEALTYDKFDISHHVEEAGVSFKENVVGTVTGFIDLFSPGADGNAARKGLGMAVLGLESYLFDPLNQKDSPWKQQVAEGRPYTKAFAKGLVGWDDWEDHPAKAGVTVAFNGLTIASGPLAAVSRMAKGGTVAKTAGTLARVGEAIDPISATARTVGATTRAIPKIAEATAHARAGFGNAPGTGSTSTVLRLSANTELHLANGEFIIFKDGVHDTTPAPVEPAANRRAPSIEMPHDHQLVGAGARAPEAGAHAGGQNLPPQANHGSPQSSAGSGGEGPSSQREAGGHGSAHRNPAGGDNHHAPSQPVDPSPGGPGGNSAPGSGQSGGGHDESRRPKPVEEWRSEDDIAGPARGKTLLYPHYRHQLSGVRSGAVDTDNTLILPETKEKVREDIAEIAAGRAAFEPETQRYLINGRRYAVEPNGRIFPVGGPGLVEMNRVEYLALKHIMKAEGDMSRLQTMFSKDPKFRGNPQSVEKAIRLYRKYYG
ncbi:hypothetical protein GCM10010277_60970 [Streptomyces longisporoflavus]|uniref:hypothetical protein n=1 Tax=Streptomyces longisporoflavus TaxID=28044 RepID=UPI00167D8761|nr:hypothetical protein [Streptomyces longisporoflavus]GGV58365.1 hypothetical protein GCM10010277_60970 [Streptomyces longisporoflavus]